MCLCADSPESLVFAYINKDVEEDTDLILDPLDPLDASFTGVYWKFLRI